MLTGDNGILTRAGEAKEETRGTAVQEERDLWILEKEMNNYSEHSTEESLEELLTRIVSQGNLTEDEKEIILGTGQITIGSRTIIFGEGDEDYIVIENAQGDGKLSEGDGSEQNPYKIQSIEDLVTLSNNVDSGETYSGKFFRLEINLDFRNAKSYIDATRIDFGDINENGTVEELMTELTTEKGFKSIGYYNTPFKGSFDGNNKAISHLYLNYDRYANGLFGYTESVKIENINLSNVNVYSNGVIGALIGACSGENNLISKVKVSGVVGGKYNAIAGIIGQSNTGSITINNAVNYCDITGSYNVGGIIGECTGSSNLRISKSSNKSKIVSGENYQVGGIIGYCDCVTNIIQCYNDAAVKINDNSGGGIVGKCSNKSLTKEKSYNTGKIEGKTNIGGIIGDYGNNTIINSCYNTGNIRTTSPNDFSNGDGIGGYYITNCYNTGELSVTKGGGISVAPVTMTNCFNIGNVKKPENTTYNYIYLGALTRFKAQNCSKNYYLSNSCLYGGCYDTLIWNGDTFTIKDIENEMESIDEIENIKTKMNETLGLIDGWKTGTEGINNGYPTLEMN